MKTHEELRYEYTSQHGNKRRGSKRKFKEYVGIINMNEKRDGLKYYLKSKSEAIEGYKDGDISNLAIDYILDKFYKYDDEVKVRLYARDKLVFKARGSLLRKKVYGNYEWFIGGECLGYALFDNVGESANLHLEHNFRIGEEVFKNEN